MIRSDVYSLWRCNEKKNGVKDNTRNAYYLDEEVVDLLNEQDKQIQNLKKSRNRWRELTHEFKEYCECYEKAIEITSDENYDKATIERINALYDQFEKECDV